MSKLIISSIQNLTPQQGKQAKSIFGGIIDLIVALTNGKK